MRGRVMALYTVVFIGSTPIGGPLVGWISEAYDPRWALGLAAFSGLLAAGTAFWIRAYTAFGRSQGVEQAA